MSVSIVNGLVDRIGKLLCKNGEITEINMYPIMFDAKILSALAEMIGAATTPLPGSVFVGMATRGLPLAAELARRFDGICVPVVKSVPMASVAALRGTRTSEYSAEAVVIPELCLPQDGVRRPVYIVDDVVATGGSARAVTDLLKGAYPHLEVQTTLCVVHFVDKCPADLPVASFFKYMSNGTYLSVGGMYSSHLVVKRAFPRGETGPSVSSITLVPPSLAYWPPAEAPDAYVIPWKTFPNGVPDLKVPAFVYDKAVRLVIDFQDRANLFDMIGFARVLALHVTDLTIVVNYFPDGTMERVDRYGTVATAEVVSHALGQMPLTKGNRKVVLEVYDLHTLQNQFYFGNKVQVEMRSVLEHLRVEKAAVVVFPDDGARKRYAPLFEDRLQLVFTKKRDGDARNVHLSDRYGMFPDGWSVKDANFAIVDDMARTFGTILETLRWLQANGARPASVDVAVPNVDTQGSALLRFFSSAPPCFRRLITFPFTRDGNAIHSSKFLTGKITPLYSSNDAALRRVTAVASENPTKVLASGCDFSVNVPSGVPPQPIGDQTMQGAASRARSASVALGGKFSRVVAFESGAVDGMEAVACTVIEEDKAHHAVHVTDTPHPAQFFPPPSQDVTTGERMRKHYNLASDEAWLGNARPRMLGEALRLALKN